MMEALMLIILLITWGRILVRSLHFLIPLLAIYFIWLFLKIVILIV